MRVIVPADLIVRTYYSLPHHHYRAECRICHKQFLGLGENGAAALVKLVTKTHVVPDHGTTVVTSREDAEILAYNIVNQLGDLWGVDVGLRQDTNDRADAFVARLIARLPVVGE